MEVAYYIKDHGYGPEDARICKGVPADECHAAMACEVAEYAWSHHDGWEWLRSGVIISLVIDGKDVGDFEITVDHEPVFYSSKHKPKGESNEQ